VRKQTVVCESVLSEREFFDACGAEEICDLQCQALVDAAEGKPIVRLVMVDRIGWTQSLDGKFHATIECLEDG
jgi:hypothetical protein